MPQHERIIEPSGERGRYGGGMGSSIRKAELYASFMPRSPRWYVAAVMTGQEMTAIEHCRRQGFELCIPMVVTGQRREQGKMVDVRRPRFVGYGFVDLDLDFDQWRSVNSTRGIRHLLPLHLERPVPLPIGFVERVQAEPEKVERIIIEYAANDLVRFISGPLESYNAAVERQDNERLFVRLENGAVTQTTVDAVERA